MKLTEESLTGPETAVFQKWLNEGGVDLFLRVLRGRVFQRECEAANKLMKVTENADAAAKQDIADAQTCGKMIELVTELRAQKKFHTYRANPDL